MVAKHRTKISRSLIGLGLTGVVLFLPQGASALPDDRSQPIRITADSAIREDQENRTRYVGNVELTQGSLIIRSDSLTVDQHDENDVVITAVGEPATLEQTPQPEATPIAAEAARIVYRQAQDTIRLRDNARIEQDGAVVSGAVIDYEVAAQRVRAIGDSTETGQRVEVVIPPSAIEPAPTGIED